MRWLNLARARLRGLLRREAVLREIDEELRSHVEMETHANIGRGMTPGEARLAALRSFGDLGRARESVYEVRGGGMLETIWQDLRFGVRMLLKKPGFTLIALITLSLGIGANTAIFSVLYGVLLKPLPYPDPNLIVRVWQAAPAAGFAQLGFSEAQLMRLRAGNQSFQQIGGYALRSADLTDQNETQRIAVASVTAGVFESLGIQPALGRAFRQEDEAPGSQRVAVLSYEMWRRQYSGDANILGQTIRL